MPVSSQWDSEAVTAAVVPPAIGMQLATYLVNPSKGQQPNTGTFAHRTLR